jgi:hypothetical protein
MFCARVSPARPARSSSFAILQDPSVRGEENSTPLELPMFTLCHSDGASVCVLRYRRPSSSTTSSPSTLKRLTCSVRVLCPTPRPATHSLNAFRASQVAFLPSIVIVPMLGSCSHRVADDGAPLPPLQGLWPVGAPAGLRGAFRAHPRPIWPLCDASKVGLGAAGWLLRLRSTVRGGLGEFGAVQLARSRAAGPA